MAIFHMSAQMLTRSKGHSATKAAAYRNAEKITDEKTGEVHDFTRKKGVYGSMILAPDNTPTNLIESSEALWNAVEKSENRSNSQVAREFNIALPNELDDDQKVALAKEFCSKHLVKHGMIVEVAFHDFDSNNGHFHAMATTRNVDPDSPTGFSKNKPREWNDKAFLEGLRESWATTANKHLEMAGFDAKIDHRSLADQKAELDAIENPTVEQQAQAISIDRDPTIHRGRSGNAERQERFDTLYQAKLTKEEEARLFGLTENTPAAPAAERPKPSPEKATHTAENAPESAKTGGGAHILKATLNELNETNTQLFDMVVDDSYQSTPEAKARLEAVKEQIGLDDSTKKHDDKNDQTPAPGRNKKAPTAKPSSATAATPIGDDFHDIKGMSKSQIEELEALDEVHAAQRKAAAETEKATSGFSANIQQSAPQSEPEPSAPAARGGSFKDRLKMTKAHLAEKSQAEEETQDHERKRRRGLGLLH